MAKNINFIPANQLPEAQGSEVNVMCLENGEMKQIPGAKLTGEPDIVIRYEAPYNSICSTEDIPERLTVEKLAADVVEKLNNFSASCHIKMIQYYWTTKFTGFIMPESVCYCDYDGCIHVIFTLPTDGAYNYTDSRVKMRINTDGTIQAVNVTDIRYAN